MTLQWRCRAGSFNQLKLVKDVDIGPIPEIGEFATVEVRAVGLNFADVFSCLGLYSATPEGEFVPGLEFAGTVVELNKAGKKKFKVGDHVYGITRFGGYTTWIHADLRYVRSIPKKWNFLEAAAFPAQALTAWYGLVELGNISKGDCVLVHSAAGGTGLWAVKIAHYFDAVVVATVGTSNKVDELKRLHDVASCKLAIIDRSESNCVEAIRVAYRTALSTLGRTHFTLIMDSLMGDWCMPGYECLAPQGRHVVYGAGSMTPHDVKPNWLSLGWKYLKRPRLDPLAMIAENKSVMAFNLIWLYEKVEQVQRLFRDLEEALPSIGLPVVGHVFNFEDAINALRLFQSGGTVGKVVLEVVRRNE